MSMNRCLLVLVLVCAGGQAVAQYSDECRDLARRLAVEPGSLSAAELDLVRDCVAALQRARLLGESVAASAPLPCAHADEPATPDCPVCPASAAQECGRPAAPAAPASRATREKPRETGEDRRPRTYIPKY